MKLSASNMSVGVLLVLAVVFFAAELEQARAQGSGDVILGAGSFEEPGEGELPRGWSVTPTSLGMGEAIRDGSDPYSGGFSLRLKPNSSNGGDGFGVYMMLDPQKVQGKDVTISGYAKASGLGDNPAALLFKTDRKSWLVIPSRDSGKYLRFSKCFTVPDSIPEAALLILVGGPAGSLRIDELIVSVDAPKLVNELRVGGSDPNKDKINTSGWQDSAFISPDGRELYFAYSPYTQKDLLLLASGKITEKEIANRGPIRDGSHGAQYMETYRSVKKQDGGWGKPENLNVNGEYSLYAAKLSLDGKKLVFVIRDGAGGFGSGDIYISERLSDGNWSSPRNLGAKVNTEWNEDTPAFGVDDQTLYFARNKGDALGWEIMISHKVNDEWTTAEKAPPPVNEPNSLETANHQPFLTADGKELYFTRIMSIFKSEKMAGGGWGEPTRVMERVSGHASLTADGRFLYFLTAADQESLERHQWTIWCAESDNNGGWGPPKPVD